MSPNSGKEYLVASLQLDCVTQISEPGEPNRTIYDSIKMGRGPKNVVYSPGMDSRLYFSEDETSLSRISSIFGFWIASRVCK